MLTLSILLSTALASSGPTSRPGDDALLGAFPADDDGDRAPAAAPLAPNRFEPALIPALAASTDLGVLLGAVGSLAWFDDVHYPYRARLEALVLVSIRRGSDGRVVSPYQEAYAQLVMPDLAAGRLRLTLRIGYQRYGTAPYFGLGNASPSPDLALADTYYQYDRTTPNAIADVQLLIFAGLKLILGVRYQHNWITAYEPSKLTEDVATGDPVVRELLRGSGIYDSGVYGVGQSYTGLLYDHRDNEFVPRYGGLYEVSTRISPGPLFGTSFLYGAVLVHLRKYQSIYRDYVVLCGRLFTELLLGDPPFYELGQYESGSIGGANAIRGVPNLRYYGKAKLLASLEVRSMFASFRLFKQEFRLGAVLFFDSGRIWTDYRPLPALDGTGVGLKWGIGTGVRLLWGQTFMVRADLAWSPDSLPIGFYFAAGQAF